MAAGLLAFSSRQFALKNQSWTFVRFTLFFLLKQAKRVAYASRGAKRLVMYGTGTAVSYFVHAAGGRVRRQQG